MVSLNHFTIYFVPFAQNDFTNETLGEKNRILYHLAPYNLSIAFVGTCIQSFGKH